MLGRGQETVVGRKIPSRIWLKIHFLKMMYKVLFRLFIISLKPLQMCFYGLYCRYGEKGGLWGIKLVTECRVGEIKYLMSVECP